MSRKIMQLFSSILVLVMTVTGCGIDAGGEKAFSYEKSEVLQENMGETTEEVLPGVEINYEALEVDYTGDVPIYDVCNYRDKIYFTCEVEGEYAGIYEMTVGDDASGAVVTDLKDGLVPKVITAGTDGSLYTVLESDNVGDKLQRMI